MGVFCDFFVIFSRPKIKSKNSLTFLWNTTQHRKNYNYNYIKEIQLSIKALYQGRSGNVLGSKARFSFVVAFTPVFVFFNMACFWEELSPPGEERWRGGWWIFSYWNVAISYPLGGEWGGVFSLGGFEGGIF